MRNDERGAQAHKLAATVLGLGIALAVSGGAPRLAWAEESLEDLQNAAIQAGEAYQQAQDKVDDLQSQQDAAEQRIAELEAQLPDQRAKAAEAIRAHYKYVQGQGNAILALLSADTLDGFIAQSSYMSAIVNSDLDAVQKLDEMRRQLGEQEDKLAVARAEAEQEAEVAKAAYDDAQQKREAAEAVAKANEAAAQAAYEADVASGTADAAINQAINNASVSSASGSSNSGSSASGSSNSGGSASGSSSSSSSSSPSYSYVAASMYGEGDGFMYGTTASGATVTPTSMGVAMKTMPLGTVIEISYNGRTVRAVVNDRGPYVGNRQIDLQPAVAHALGFDGVGTVGYRVVS